MLRKKGLRYTIDDMTVVLYSQGSKHDLSAMFSISGQLLDVEWIDNLILSCKFFEEDEAYFEDWKQGYAEMRERKQEREARKKLANG
ncbi:MAG: hypothetical protein R3Y67_10200 [Eubacteriales bacterium]